MPNSNMMIGIFIFLLRFLRIFFLTFFLDIRGVYSEPVEKRRSDCSVPKVN
jgi:hypothetical protein